MEALISLARAARLAGVSRGEIQELVRKGRLPTFEGMVETADLLQIYPHVRLTDTRMLERVARIQEEALGKSLHTQVLPQPEMLLRELALLRGELARVRAEARAYGEIVQVMQDKLVEVHEQCDRRQRVLLQSLVTWLLQALKEREHY